MNGRKANHEGPDRITAGQGLVVTVSTSAPEGFEPLTFCSESIPLVRAEELRVVLVALVNGVLQLPTLLTRCGPFRSFQVGKGWATLARDAEERGLLLGHQRELLLGRPPGVWPTRQSGRG
jgi:hypothetical protein